MKIVPFLLALALALPVATLSASAQTAPEKLFTPGTEIPALITRARAAHKSPTSTTTEPVLALAPYQVNLEYRTGVTPPTIHHGQAEMVQVLKGTAILATGGELTGIRPSRPGSTTNVGTGIEGASKQKLAVGDYAMIPPETPHQFQDIHGEFVIISIHPIMPEKQD